MASLVPLFLIGSFFILAGNEDMHKSLVDPKPPLTMELAALERLKNQCFM